MQQEKSLRERLEKTYTKARKDYLAIAGDKKRGHIDLFPDAASLTIDGLLDKISKLTGLLSSANLVNQIKSGKTIKRQREIIEDKNTDKTTQLGTKDYFIETLENMHADELYHDSFAILNIDVNDLKKLNDTHGHAAGDRYLATLGRAINQQIRVGDRAFRTGGDEFIIILKCTIDEANNVARRVLRDFLTLWDKRHNVTGGFSYGIASATEPQLQERLEQLQTTKERIQEILRVADGRQYEHKLAIKAARRRATDRISETDDRIM